MKWIFIHMGLILTMLLVACSGDSALTESIAPHAAITLMDYADRPPALYSIDSRNESSPGTEVLLSSLTRAVDAVVKTMSASELAELVSDETGEGAALEKVWSSNAVKSSAPRLSKIIERREITEEDIVRHLRNDLKTVKPRKDPQRRATPCFDKYQRDMNAVGAEFWSCASKLGLPMGKVNCVVKFYAKSSALKQAFKNCVDYGIKN